MKKIIYLLFLSGLLSCTSFRNKYFIRLSDGAFDEYLLNKQVDSLTIDNTYKFYVREICRRKPADGYYFSGDPDITADVERCNCRDSSFTYQKEKLEVQYLLVSWEHKKFIYITTIPPGVGNGKPTYDRNIFKIPNYININYFNTFFFGDIVGNTFSFETDDPTRIIAATRNPRMLWEFEVTTNEAIDITVVHGTRAKQPISYSTAETMQGGLKFYKCDRFDIGISDEVNATKLCKENNNLLKGNRIYFLTTGKNLGRRIEKIAFAFDSSFVDNTSPIKRLYFPVFRLKSSPIAD